MSAISRATTRTAVLADVIPGSRVRDVALVALHATAIALSAQVAFPLPGTPILVTGQTFVVLLGAAALGSARASSGALLFALLGLTGLPLFAHASGVSLGYIAGFVLASAVVGTLARRGWVDTAPRAAVSMIVGNLAIYLLGVPVVALVMGVGVLEAITLGVVPFLVGDAAKIALATVILPFVQRAVADRQ
ncbi:MAG: biotin transporter BioY [Nitriliruptoraceae bacterium]